MIIQEDKDFLIMQRQKGRPGYMGGVDLQLAKKEQKRFEKEQQEANRKRKYYERNEHVFEAQTYTSSSESEVESKLFAKRIAVDAVASTSSAATLSTTITRRGRTNFINPRLVATLDKCKVSDRFAIHIIIAVAEALGHSVDNLVINKTSIQRCRTLNRIETALQIKTDFKASNGIVVHWDGKILPDITGSEKVDRLPVIITQNNVEQLLGVPKLDGGTGEEMASAVFELLTEWDLKNHIQAMCFDTTSSNTGIYNGACTLLEQKLERSLLYLPCRHHISELVLRAVFELKICSTSSGPVPSIFSNFQKIWSKINQNEYKTGIEEEDIADKFKDDIDDIMNFCLHEYKKPICRDDYRELLQLTMIFLGNSNIKNIRSPGPVHHARWMAKALYCLKIYIYRDRLKLKKKEEKGLKEMCIFVVKFYVKYWFRCPIAAEAPQNDLNFLKDLCDYIEIDKELSYAVIKKFSGHLWYLSDEAIAFSFFDKNVSVQLKKKMVQTLKSIDNAIETCKRIRVKPSTIIETYRSIDLSDFITANTNNLFKRFNISTSFLECDPSTWISREDYKKGLELITNLKVVNDTAERGVKLIEEFNKILTKKEDEKQYLLQVVKNYRQKFPSHNKSTLSSTNMK